MYVYVFFICLYAYARVCVCVCDCAAHPLDILTLFYYLTKGGNSHKVIVDRLNIRIELN